VTEGYHRPYRFGQEKTFLTSNSRQVYNSLLTYDSMLMYNYAVIWNFLTYDPTVMYDSGLMGYSLLTHDFKWI